jgi:uncharacterized protein (TIGR03118 family)
MTGPVLIGKSHYHAHKGGISMRTQPFPARPRLLAVVITIAILLLLLVPVAAYAQGGGFYQQTNLVSDLPNVAKFQDTNLVNPWGLSHGPTTPWWVSDNGKGVSTLYNGQGQAFPVGSPLVVTIPPPNGSPAGTTAAPTGNVFNGTSDFVVSGSGGSGPSRFIFATEDGTISGWNPTADPTHAILAVDRSTASQGGFVGAVYKGLATGSNASGNFIYATNFRFGTVEMFNASFKLVGSFTDSKLANTCPLPNQCYAPFGIQNIGGNLYVTFALQDAAHHDDMAGPAHGFVDVFDTSGNLIQRLISHGRLNSPWGLAHAPADFGLFSNALLVGNFGNGRINAYDLNSGEFLGQLRDQSNTPITIDGLWALGFGNDANAGLHNELFFTAGINDEADGLFGKITFVS